MKWTCTYGGALRLVVGLQVRFTSEVCFTNSLQIGCPNANSLSYHCLVQDFINAGHQVNGSQPESTGVNRSQPESTGVNRSQPVCLVLFGPVWSSKMFQGRSRSSVMGQCGIDCNSDQLLALQRPSAGWSSWSSCLIFGSCRLEFSLVAIIGCNHWLQSLVAIWQSKLVFPSGHKEEHTVAARNTYINLYNILS